MDIVISKLWQILLGDGNIVFARRIEWAQDSGAANSALFPFCVLDESK